MGFFDVATKFYRPSTYGIGGGGESKASRRAVDVANQDQEAQAILESFLSLLVPGSEEYTQLLAEGLSLARTAGDTPGDQQDQIRVLGQSLVNQQTSRLAQGGAVTPLEARTDQAFGTYRDVAEFTPEEQAIFDALRGLTPETGTPSFDIFSETVDRARSPEDYFESTLAPQLTLAEDAVKRRAAQRGTLGSGIELEQLGRAGVDLAIKEAEAREAFRRSQVEDYERLYNAGQGLREREIGVEKDRTNMQFAREGSLTSLLEGSSQRGLKTLLGLQTGRVDQALGERDRIEREALAREEALLKTIGQGAKFAASAAFPPAAPAILSADLASGGIEDLLAQSRSGNDPYGIRPRKLASSLSRSGI